MNIKDKYKKRLQNPDKPKSQKANSYVRAIEILSEILGRDLFQERDLDNLQDLYVDLKQHQTDPNGKYHYPGAPSYGESRYYSSAIRELIDFLKAKGIGNTVASSDYLIPINKEIKPNEEPHKPAYNGDDLYEGSKKTITVNTYNRNIKARRECIELQGCTCCVCGFNFAQVYGEIGEGFIHVHHLEELSSIGEDQKVDPENDLRPVCPNCHAMLHRRTPPYTLQELQNLMNALQHNQP